MAKVLHRRFFQFLVMLGELNTVSQAWSRRGFTEFPAGIHGFPGGSSCFDEAKLRWAHKRIWWSDLDRGRSMKTVDQGSHQGVNWHSRCSRNIAWHRIGSLLGPSDSAWSCQSFPPGGSGWACPRSFAFNARPCVPWTIGASREMHSSSNWIRVDTSRFAPRGWNGLPARQRPEEGVHAVSRRIERIGRRRI